LFQIISTLGPASLNTEFLELCDKYHQLYFRLNGSHLNETTLYEYIKFVKRTLPGKSIQFYLDLQGSKIRIGELAQPLMLREHQMITLASRDSGSEAVLHLPGEVFAQLRSSLEVLLQDGTIRLRIVQWSPHEATAEVIQGGTLRSRAGIYFRGLSFFQRNIPYNQKVQIQIAAKSGITHLALSFIQSAEEMNTLREFCEKIEYSPKFIAKIERPEALQRLSSIISVADEVWYCRGDLGEFLPWKELGPWQEKTIQIARQQQKPVFIAGQVFQHMTNYPQPTRSEVVHFHYIRKQGVSGIVLSDETAIGQFPQHALQVTYNLI